MRDENGRSLTLFGGAKVGFLFRENQVAGAGLFRGGDSAGALHRALGQVRIARQGGAQGQIQTSPTLSLGIGTVNLRGVSTNRTLVLVDGRRAQPSNASLVVDINSIPVLMVTARTASGCARDRR